MTENTFTLPISPKKIAMILFGFILFLVLASLIGQFYKETFADNEIALKIIRKFDLDYERNNLPTWYQSSTLLFSSFLLAIIALSEKAGKNGKREKNENRRYWAILSIVFLYLSLDESVSIHEQLTLPLRNAFGLEGFFYLSWVIPAAVLLVVFFFAFLKFLQRLPKRIRYSLIAAGAIYIAGAVGMEMVGGNYLYVTGDLPSRVVDFRYVLITTFEEFLEMTGILIFIHTLLDYLFPQTAPAAERRALVERGEKNYQGIGKLERKIILN